MPKTIAKKAVKSIKTVKKPELNVVCMWWRREDGSEKFSKEYVNRLYRMVKKNMILPHRFVCFTEDSKGLDKGIETFPLPPVKLRNGLPERGWKKLGLLSEKLGDLKGIGLFLDLDVVIIDNIDDLFRQPGKFIISRDSAKDNLVGNSSVFRFEIGKHQDILDYFEKNFEKIRHEVRHEQAYMSREMHKKGIFSFWNGENCPMCKSWVRSFKNCCILRFPFNWFITPKLPVGAKIILFHGRPINEEAMNGYTAKFGLRHIRPTKWIKKYWMGK